MAVSHGYSKITTSGSVFAFDTGDVYNSYKGEPTTNIYGTSFRDFTGTTYSPSGEWTSNPTQLVKTYFADLPTPIGPGATLIEESGSTGYHHLSRYGGSNESGLHTISCYLYPLTSSITDFTIGMLADSGNSVRFNLATRQITYGAGITNRNAIIEDVPNWPGWLRVGANIEGRVGGWVGALGYSAYASYTGTAGSKKCYITGIQYEYKDHVTQFVGGTRSALGSLFDVSGYNKSVNCTSAFYNSSAQLFFSGSNFLTVDPLNRLLTHTVEALFRPTEHPNNNGCVVADQYTTTFVNYKLGYTGIGTMSGGFYSGSWRETPSITTTLNTWQHVVYTYDGATLSIYKNALLGGTTSFVGFPNTTGNSLRIGRRWDLEQFFVGDISVVRIYDRALTPAEILDNYNHYKTRFNLP